MTDQTDSAGRAAFAGRLALAGAAGLATGWALRRATAPKPVAHKPRNREAQPPRGSLLGAMAQAGLALAGARATQIPPTALISADGSPLQALLRQFLPRAPDAPRDPYHEEPVETRAGALARSPVEIPARGWLATMKRTVREIGNDRVMSVAGGVTFFVLLALFPAITAMLSVYGLFASRADLVGQITALSGTVPDGMLEIIAEQAQRLIETPSATLGLATALSLALAFWSANGGTKALVESLNVAYGEREKRGFFKLNALTLGMTLGAVVLVIGLVGLVGVLPVVLKTVWLGDATEAILRWGRWPLMMLVLVTVLAVLYRWGPSRRDAKWRWITPGAVIAALGLILFSAAFSYYAANFANYNETYGSLGAVIGALMWVWLSVVIVLVGAELNAELERQTLRDTTTGRPKPIGARGAVVADSK